MMQKYCIPAKCMAIQQVISNRSNIGDEDINSVNTIVTT